MSLALSPASKAVDHYWTFKIRKANAGSNARFDRLTEWLLDSPPFLRSLTSRFKVRTWTPPTVARLSALDGLRG